MQAHALGLFKVEPPLAACSSVADYCVAYATPFSLAPILVIGQGKMVVTTVLTRFSKASGLTAQA